MRKFLTVLAALSFAGSAYAADIPRKAPPVVPLVTASWTGWYVGINGGYGWGRNSTAAQDVRPDYVSPAQTFLPSSAVQPRGSTIRVVWRVVKFGYLYQAGPAIFGVEAGIDWAGIKGSRTNGPTVYPVTPPSTFTWNLNSKTDWLATFLGRVGYDMGSWYPYLTGGVALANVSYSANFVDTFYPTNNTFPFSRTKATAALGAGAEWRVAPHWLVRGEYLYMNFGSVGGTGVIACTPGVGACVGAGFRTPFIFNTSFRENIVRLALSYQM